MINRKIFYQNIKSELSPLHDYLVQKQVKGYEIILDAWEQDKQLTDHRWLAYMLATVYHETARTMQPIEEYGKGKGKAYGQPDRITGKTYYGRGYVQLTWKENYKKFEDRLGFPLVMQPELACNPNIACDILFDGMIHGLFTGRKLSDYINSTTLSDFVGARKIINGKDKARTIAKYAEKYLTALSEI
ncbi:MAG TPA: hypothetical protein PKM40_07610 [Bacteroidia bacterium]|nr:hypothetical protein [Bacteroidia bacterium]